MQALHSAIHKTATFRGATRLSYRSRTRAVVLAQRVGEDVPNVFKGQRLQNTGYVDVDNTGKGNVFPTLPKMYVNSSTADEAAKQGLGGSAGVAVVAAVLAVLAVLGVGALSKPATETLDSVSGAYAGDSLTAIASRIQATL